MCAYKEYTTLDEAIDHFVEMASSCQEAADALIDGTGKELSLKHARQYTRLVAWLNELKDSRERLDNDWK